MLFTKSIQAKPKKTDGIRICIMRKPGADAVYDIWMPTLSPSLKLLTDYHKKKVDWAGYEKRFNKEVIMPYRDHIKLLTEIALKRKVTILCWEETPEKCHRRLIAEVCEKINPELKVVYK